MSWLWSLQPPRRRQARPALAAPQAWKADLPIACYHAVVKVNSMPKVPSLACHPAPIMPGPHEPFIMPAEPDPIMPPLTYWPPIFAHCAKSIVLPFVPCKLGERCTTYVAFALSVVAGMTVSTWRLADQLEDPMTCGPVTDPSCTTTSISMPDIIAMLNVTMMGFEESTPVVAAAGSTLSALGESVVSTPPRVMGDELLVEHAPSVRIEASVVSAREVRDMKTPEEGGVWRARARY